MRHANDWPTKSLESVGECPICRSQERENLHSGVTDGAFQTAPGRWDYYRCSSCSCAYLSPRPTRSSIGKAYANYYTHQRRAFHFDAPPSMVLGEARARMANGYLNRRYGYELHPANRWGYWVVRAFPLRRIQQDRRVRYIPSAFGSGRLLDVGSGSGLFVEWFRRLGWKSAGIDADAKALRRSEWGSGWCTQALVEDPPLRQRTFSVITMGHVLEHLHDPVGALEDLHKLLEPNGLLWISTPNLSSIGHMIFGREWRGVEAPRHLVLFTPSSIKEALLRAGYQSIKFLPSAGRARWFFGASRAIQEGCDPQTVEEGPTSVSLSLAAKGADLLALLRPSLGEELLVSAVKP